MDKFLSDDELWYAARHNLPLLSNQYNDAERAELRKKTEEEKYNQQKNMEIYKKKVLFGYNRCFRRKKC